MFVVGDGGRRDGEMIRIQELVLLVPEKYKYMKYVHYMEFKYVHYGFQECALFNPDISRCGLYCLFK